MKAEAILEWARALGVTLSAAGDRVRYPPKSRAPAEFVKTLREYKPELIALLRGQPEVDPLGRTQNPRNPQIPGADRNSAESAARETERLLAWATKLAEQEVVLPRPVRYIEAPLRTITTDQVSRYASIYLRTIVLARSNQRSGGWHIFTCEWWTERKREAMGALVALREAMQDLDAQEAER